MFRERLHSAGEMFMTMHWSKMWKSGKSMYYPGGTRESAKQFLLMETEDVWFTPQRPMAVSRDTIDARIIEILTLYCPNEMDE